MILEEEKNLFDPTWLFRPGSWRRQELRKCDLSQLTQINVIELCYLLATQPSSKFIRTVLKDIGGRPGSSYIFICGTQIHCKKRVSDFPVPSRDVTNQTLPDREKIKLFLSRESFVSDIPVGDVKIANLFFTVYTILRSLILAPMRNNWKRTAISAIQNWILILHMYSICTRHHAISLAFFKITVCIPEVANFLF